MQLKNVINTITRITLIYYHIYINKYRDITSIKNNVLLDIYNDNIFSNKVFLYMKNVIITEYANIFDINMELYNISLFSFPVEQQLYFTEEELNSIDIEDIISSYFHERNTIGNDNIILSINICPFDGLDIRHGDIINTLDFYLY